MKKLLIGIAASALMITGAIAADPVITIAPSYEPAAAGFDWDGFYMGVGVAGAAFSPGFTETQLSLIAGVNMTSGNMLFGLEGMVSAVESSGWFWLGGAQARLGYLVSPEALVYVAGGGYVYSGGNTYGTIGGGIEFAVSDNVSLDLEYKYWDRFSSNWTGNSISLSANWHF